jgi:hypothetical protein
MRHLFLVELKQNRKQAGSAAQAIDGTGRASAANLALRVFLLLDAGLLLIGGVHLLAGSPFDTVKQVFALQGETSIPIWYASAKFLIVAALLALLAVGVEPSGRANPVLLGVAFIFLMMSCDEAAGLHERLQILLDKRLLSGDPGVSTVPRTLAKVVLGVAAFLVLCAAVIGVFRTLRLCGPGRNAFALGFVLLATGALGLDLGQVAFQAGTTTADLGKILEEVLELCGVTIMIYGLLQALSCAPVDVHLGSRWSIKPRGHGETRNEH